jgi:NADH-quinone oxidoreductase subunit G
VDETAQKTDTVTLTIDGLEATVPKGLNLIQAAETVGIEISHFCYHPALPIAGNCRMCLVEIEGPRGKALVIACNTQAGDGMKVETHNEKVLEARKGIMEFLLLNHPTDCPICDQVGECRLHEYYSKYDLQPSRMKLEKVHAAKHVDAGPTLVHDRERCIRCTRCVRFAANITKTFDTSIEYRGDHSILCLPPGHKITNNYSECIADVCPVGAFTSRKFRFKKRVYFLESIESVCPGCSRGCNILAQYDPMENEIYRLKPRFNSAVNQHWMCDIGRWCFKLFQGEERLVSPATDSGRKAHGPEEAVELAAKELSGVEGDSFIIGNPMLSNEDVYMLLKLAEAMGVKAVAHHPKPGDSEWEKLKDDLLINIEKSPNSTGAEALGLGKADFGRTLGSLLDDLKDGKFEAGIIVGQDPASLGHEVSDALEKLKFLLVIDTKLTKTGKMASLVMPTATVFERAGTFVNGDGRVQKFAAAVCPPGNVVAPFAVFAAILEKMALVDAESKAASVVLSMLKTLGVETPEGADENDVAALLEAAKETGRKACEQDVLNLIRAEADAFRNVTDAELGAFGAVLEGR